MNNAARLEDVGYGVGGVGINSKRGKLLLMMRMEFEQGYGCFFGFSISASLDNLSKKYTSSVVASKRHLK